MLLAACGAGSRRDGGDVQAVIDVQDAAPFDAAVADGADGDADAPTDVPIDRGPVTPPGALETMGFWPPVIAYTTPGALADVHGVGIDLMLGTNHETRTTAQNRAALAAAASAGVGWLIADARLTTPPVTPATIAATVADYASSAGHAGWYLRDEPEGFELDALAQEYRAIRAADPAHPRISVNLLGRLGEVAMLVRTPATLDDTATDQGASRDGVYVTPTQPLGQTFRTGAAQTTIQAITLHVDHTTWSAGQALTLTLYDSPARANALAARTLTATNGADDPDHPVFTLDAAVAPATVYYAELSSAALPAVGWVTRSTSDVEPSGQGYVAGAATPTQDFFFTASAASADERDPAHVLDTSGGDYVSPTQSFGQTFTTPADATLPLTWVELEIDPTGWAADEVLTLTIWDSPAKSRRLASASLAGNSDTNGKYPRFPVLATLEPGHGYYMELTHDGGGDGRQGWVTWATSPFAGGVGYLGGVAQGWSLHFRAHYGLDDYGRYFDRWISAARPAFASFDHYVIDDGGVPGFYADLAVARERARFYATPLWTYVLSVQFASHPLPSAARLRWNVYASLAFGVRGIEYFTYWTPAPDMFDPTPFSNGLELRDGTHGPLYASAAALDRELHALSPLLGAASSEAVYRAAAGPSVIAQPPPDGPVVPLDATTPLLIGVLRHPDGRRIVVLVNEDTAAAHTVTLSFPGLPAGVLEASKADGSLGPAAGYAAGRMSLALEAGDARVLVLP